jgi:hypothetical protein
LCSLQENDPCPFILFKFQLGVLTLQDIVGDCHRYDTARPAAAKGPFKTVTNTVKGKQLILNLLNITCIVHRDKPSFLIGLEPLLGLLVWSTKTSWLFVASLFAQMRQNLVAQKELIYDFHIVRDWCTKGRICLGVE